MSNLNQDEMSKDEIKRQRIKLRRDLLAKKDTLRREELRYNKLEFENRKLIKEDEQFSADITDKENKLKRIADDLRLLEENVVAKKKTQRRLNDEIKNVTRKSEEFRFKKADFERSIENARSVMAGLAGEIKKLEDEIKKL